MSIPFVTWVRALEECEAELYGMDRSGKIITMFASLLTAVTLAQSQSQSQSQSRFDYWLGVINISPIRPELTLG